MKSIYFFTLLCIACVANTTLHAQTPDDEEGDMYSLSLEELLNIPISSASKKDETLFDAPLSSYTITRADIEKAGSTSIMEALRLAPGVIVREQTNGVYDIHIRGFDNISRYDEDYNKSNVATLIMIDNRPVFNHNLGGTFWESLPIDIHDVVRIEIVRGPSAPLFGPNAVTGVINIITKRANNNNTVDASVSYGTPSSLLANASLGKKVSDQFNFIVSGNYQTRNRFDDTYFLTGDTYVKYNQFPQNVQLQYPNPEIATSKWGANAFMVYKPTEKVNLDFSFGLQKSEVQRNFVGNVIDPTPGAQRGTMFNTMTSESQYANLTATVYGLAIRTSYLFGTDDLNKNLSPSQYDFNVGDIVAEYEIKVANNLNIVPGISYQSVSFSDDEYVNKGITFLNGTEVSIHTTSGFLRTDYKPFKSLRILAAVRADKFSSPDDVYVAYEFASTFSINSKNLIRAAVTRSNSGSFIANNFLDLRVPVAPGVDFVRGGQTNLKLFTIDMMEIGYRLKLTQNFQADLDVFQQEASNFVSLVAMGPLEVRFANVPTVAIQRGATLSLNFVPNQNLHIKPFVTFQNTKTQNAGFEDEQHRNTPAFYGGYYLDYKASKKMNINVNGYYFASHRQYDNMDPGNTGEAGDIQGKFLINLKASYMITDKLNFFVNGRNILNNDSREYFGTDRIGGFYTIGARLSIN